MTWQMAEEFRALVQWAARYAKAKRLRRCVMMDRSWLKHVLRRFFFAWPLMLLARWQERARGFHNGKPACTEEVSARQFTADFIAAVDDDGDGGLSLCELKAAQWGYVGNSNELFAKASK